MTEYSRCARGSFTSAGNAQTIVLPFQPTRVEFQNYTAYSSPAQYSMTQGFWDISMGQGVAAFEYIEAASLNWITAVDYTTSGVTTFGTNLSLLYGAQQQVIGITKASSGVVNVTAHGYNVGDVVVFEGLYQSSTTGMPQICGIPFQITAVSDANHFTIGWNTNQTNYTAISGSPTGAYVKKVLNPFMYLPGQNVISAITTGTTTTVTTTTNHNYVVGQEIAFRIPTAWGTTQLNSLPNNVIPGSPIYGYVTSVTSNTVFVCSINSSAYTAFNSNPTVASVPGLSFPQVVAVGDVNSGGLLYSGGVLYPSPSFPTYSGGTPTYGGPGIQGAFANNTRQGFVLGNGAGVAQTNVTGILGTSQLINWQAYLYDV